MVAGKILNENTSSKIRNLEEAFALLLESFDEVVAKLDLDSSTLERLKAEFTEVYRSKKAGYIFEAKVKDYFSNLSSHIDDEHSEIVKTKTQLMYLKNTSLVSRGR